MRQCISFLKRLGSPDINLQDMPSAAHQSAIIWAAFLTDVFGETKKPALVWMIVTKHENILLAGGHQCNHDVVELVAGRSVMCREPQDIISAWRFPLRRSKDSGCWTEQTCRYLRRAFSNGTMQRASRLSLRQDGDRPNQQERWRRPEAGDNWIHLRPLRLCSECSTALPCGTSYFSGG